MSLSDSPAYYAFLRAIGREPGADVPRLACADWLDENGDAERADFIRTQVERARLIASGQGETPQAEALRLKERSYLKASSYLIPLWAAEACPELVKCVPNERGRPGMHIEGSERITFRRGFVEEVTCSVAEWQHFGEAIRTRLPLRVVFLTGCGTTTRDDCYAMISSLLHLEEVVLAGLQAGLRDWLMMWLPDTRVTEFA